VDHESLIHHLVPHRLSMIDYKVSIESKDMGLDKLLKNIRTRAKEPSHAVVGMPESAGEENVRKAVLGEFGGIQTISGKDGSIRQSLRFSRPWLRHGFAKAEPEASKMMSEIAKRATDPKLGLSNHKFSLAPVADMMANVMKTLIRNKAYRRNAESTIRRKKSDTPLIDTGEMVDAIDFEIRGGK